MGSEQAQCAHCRVLRYPINDSEIVGLVIGEVWKCECGARFVHESELQRSRARVAELEAKIAESERRAEYWKAEHLAGNEVIAELESKLAAATKRAGEEDRGL